MTKAKFCIFSLLFIIFTVSSSCMSISDRIERKEARYASTCEGYGFEKGTPSYKQCIVLEKRDRKAKRDASVANQAALANCSNRGGSYGGGYCLNARD